MHAVRSRLVAARDEELGGADRAYPALRKQLGRQLSDDRRECALGVGDLLRESLDALAEPTQDAVHDLLARP